ncbi:hypothetical protein [Nocardia yamanashiensis]|uniref:hypothetical protein n=1 Tax=Nocardia yamanashiensis TaxID=209247 RepID=UPI0008373FEA|nr:hypothetical protein [Nocardia yamanashiensis]
MSEEERRIHAESAKQDEREMIPEPEIEEKHRKRAHEMAEAYKDERPLTVMPGTDGMVSGTAVTDWVDEQGRPIFGKDA